MIKGAYDTGVKTEILYNINSNEIILTKIDNKYLAIKLIYVIDELGISNDKYEFSIKR